MTDIVGDLTTAITTVVPSSQDLVKNLLLGAGTTVVLSGLKSQDGQNALDPLHLVFHQPTQAATASSPAVARPTATAAAFATFSPAAQAAFFQAGGIVAG